MSLCPVCKLEIASNQPSCKYKNKVYHEACLRKKEAAARAKDTKKSSASNDPSYLTLKKYLLQLFSLDDLTPSLTRQIENMHQQLLISYEDMYVALYYFFTLMSNPIDSENPTIGIVPYVLKDSKEFMSTIHRAEASNADFIPQNRSETVQVVVCHAPRLGYRMEDL